MTSTTLQDDPSVESFLNIVETETHALFKYLSFEFLDDFDAFTPAKTGRTRDRESPELMRGFSTANTRTSMVLVQVSRSFRTRLFG